MVVKVERKVVFGTKKNRMYVNKEYLEDSKRLWLMILMHLDAD